MSAESSKCILIAGGAGYIGSHTTVEVLQAGYSAVVIDNLCNSSEGMYHTVLVLSKLDEQFIIP